MADKYAVSSGRWSDTATWSDTDGGAGGATLPADDDAVFILSNISVQMDVDLSAYTGLRAVTIRGHATTPGMLYWKTGAGPGLRIGTTKTNIRTDRFSFLIGSTFYTSPDIAAGTALSGSDVPDGTYGAWALDIGTDLTIHCTEATDNATGYASAVLAIAGLPAVAASHVRVGTVTASNTGAVFDPGVTELDAATVTEAYADIADTTFSYGYLKIRTTYNLVGTTGTAKGRLLANSDGTWGSTGSLTFANKAIIDLGATSTIDAQYLDIALYCTNDMTHKYLTTYAVRHTVTGSAAANTLTKNLHGLANTTPVMIMSDATLPAPLVADTVYYVVNTATNTFQLATVSGGTAIDLTTDGSGTIEVYTGAASSADPVSVFEDVSSESGWTNTTGHNRVVIVNAGPQNYDQQRLTITTLDTNHIHLSAALDSLQYPGARIYLMARNVSIRSCTTAVNIVNYANASSSSGIFQCEIWASAGTGTTFYGYGINSGTGHTVSGTISGCTYGIQSGTGHTISGTISGCGSTFRFGGTSTLPLSCIVRGVASITSTFYARGDPGDQGVYFENYLGVLGASYAVLPCGDIVKNTSIIRVGGAASSLEVIPQSTISIYGFVKIFEWIEFGVPTGSVAKTVYIKGEGWSTFPTAAQLYIEAEYLSHASLMTKATVASTDVLTDNTTWTAFAVAFNPLQVGYVRYRGYLKVYGSSCKVYVDNMIG